MGADFTPTLGVYNTVRPFRFWCQKVLPLVYDDSLSYYEMLCKVRDYLNKLIEDVSTAEDNIQDLAEAYAQLEEYVNTYFDSLDVSEEIDAKLDAMATDGTLTNLIEPIASNIVSEWLEEHVTPTTPAVDTSLTISGAAADAKTVGDYFEGTVMSRATLTSNDDLNSITNSGIYYVATNDYPSNLPVEHSGRLLVVKARRETFAISCQLYFEESTIWYRIAENNNSESDAWTGVSWYKVAESSAFDGVIMNRGTLTSSYDLNELENPGLYYVDSVSGYPLNMPMDVPGRLLVLKSQSSSHASNAQLLFTNSPYMRIFVRCSKSVVGSEAWSDVEWTRLATNESLTEYIGSTNDQLKIPLSVGTFTSGGRYTNANNRVRPNFCLRNVTNFKLTGYKIRIYYYSENYTLTSRNQGVAPDSFLYAAPWTSLDDYVSPEVGTWFSFMIAKSNDGNFTAADVDYVRENLYCEGVSMEDVYYQTNGIPYNATEYHAKWDSMIDGEVVKRVLLGKVNDDDTLPIYAYELHLQKNYVTSTYGLVNYDGSNELYPRRKALIIAGVHGNEKCTPMDALLLAQELISGKLKEYGALYDWYFIPLLNPWGYSHIHLDSNGNIVYGNGAYASTALATSEKNAGIRTNGEGMDINRDWSDTTYTVGGTTYGFQTKELNIIKSYVQANKWDLYFDLHQNHEDRDASMNRVNAYVSFAFGGSTNENKKNAMYELVDNACRKVNMTLEHYFNRGARSKQCAVNWNRESATSASLAYYTSVNYLGGFDNGTIGNTSHKAIASDYSFAIETSEVSYSYGIMADAWYNPYACVASASTIINTIVEAAKAITNAYYTNGLLS